MNTVEQYPRDEFDELGDKRGLRGTHRKPRHPLVTAAPIIAALIIGPAAGWATVELMSQDGMSNPFITEETPDETQTPAGNPSGDTNPTDEPSGEPSDEPSDEPTDDEDPADEPTEDETVSEPTLPPVPGVVYDASVALLNGTGTETGAEPAHASLVTAGYTKIDSSDYPAGAPAGSAIYFASPEFYETARNIATTLNIDYWAENAALAGDSDVVIILR